MGEANNMKCLYIWKEYMQHFCTNYLPYPFVSNFPSDLRRRHKSVQTEIITYLNIDQNWSLHRTSLKDVIDFLAEHLKTIIAFEASIHLLQATKGFIRFDDSILKLIPFVTHTIKLLKHQKKSIKR